MGGDRGSVCPTMGPGAPCVPRWDQIHPYLLSPSFLLLSCLSPASPSRSMSVLVSLPRAPWALTPAVSPAPPGAEASAPTSHGRHHHRCSLERVPGNRATSVLLSVPLCVPSSVCVHYCVHVSGLSVCLPAPLLPTLSGWSLCPLHWGQIGMRRCGGRGGRDTLVFVGLVVMSDVLTSGAVPAGTQDLQEVFPFRRQHLLGQLHLPAAGEWGWGRGGPRCLPSPRPLGLDTPVLS